MPGTFPGASMLVVSGGLCTPSLHNFKASVSLRSLGDQPWSKMLLLKQISE